MTGQLDEARLGQLMGTMAGHMTGGAMCFSVWLGDELGLYRVLAGAGPAVSQAIAEEAGCHPRLVREWLDAQVAGGLIDYDPDAGTYRLSPEAIAVLADDSSPAFVARGMNALAAMFFDQEKVAAAFRGDGALPWGDHNPCLFVGNEWFFRTGYRAYLPTQWIPSLQGMEEKLRQGARVADVGCGHGASAIVMAEAYPESRIWGFDLHPASIATAVERAGDAGVADRVAFAIADAKNYPGEFDLICFFDCLHDMGDPVGAARHAREHLAADGTVLLVEPFALDDRPTNLRANPMAALFYTASTAVCLPNSLSQEVGLALGAQAGEERLRQVFEEAGFTRFRRATETPTNLILEARA